MTLRCNMSDDRACASVSMRAARPRDLHVAVERDFQASRRLQQESERLRVASRTVLRLMQSARYQHRRGS